MHRHPPVDGPTIKGYPRPNPAQDTREHTTGTVIITHYRYYYYKNNNTEDNVYMDGGVDASTGGDASPRRHDTWR